MSTDTGLCFPQGSSANGFKPSLTQTSSHGFRTPQQLHMKYLHSKGAHPGIGKKEADRFMANALLWVERFR